MKTITATEFARRFKQMMDLVEFQGEELTIIRNNHQVARITPGPAKMTALEAMGDLYRTLSEDAGRHWIEDSRKFPKGSLAEVKDPWAS